MKANGWYVKVILDDQVDWFGPYELDDAIEKERSLGDQYIEYMDYMSNVFHIVDGKITKVHYS